MIDATKLITTLLEKKGYEKIDLHVLEQLKDQFPDTPLFATSYKKKLLYIRNTS